MVNQFGIRNNFIRNIAISIEFSIFCSQQIHPLCERFHAIYAPIKSVDCDLVFLWSKIRVQVKSHTKWCTNQSDAIISSKSMRLVLACNTLYGVSICERGGGGILLHSGCARLQSRVDCRGAKTCTHHEHRNVRCVRFSPVLYVDFCDFSHFPHERFTPLPTHKPNYIVQ